MCNRIGYYYTSRGCDRGRPLDGGRSVKLREIGMMRGQRDEVKRQPRTFVKFYYGQYFITLDN